jgi:hypothetical protein
MGRSSPCSSCSMASSTRQLGAIRQKAPPPPISRSRRDTKQPAITIGARAQRPSMNNARVRFAYRMLDSRSASLTFSCDWSRTEAEKQSRDK